MKKNLFYIVILLILSGCTEINQPLEILPSQFKSISKWITNEDKATVSKPTDETRNKPNVLSAEQSPPKLDTYPTEARTEPAKQSSTLNISMPKEIIVQEMPAEEIAPQATHDIEVKLAEIDQAAPSKTAVVRELKPATAIEHISLTELNNQNWQISRILIPNNFMAHESHWLFNFNKTGKYKAFGACNYLTGKFNASDDGAFRLGKLETSLNDCPESKDEEVMVFNMLLMADSFAIRGEKLVLKSGGKVMMEFKTSDQEINVKMAQKSHNKKDKKALKDKKSSKAKASKKKSQKNVQPNLSQPTSQKNSHINRNKKK